PRYAPADVRGAGGAGFRHHSKPVEFRVVPHGPAGEADLRRVETAADSGAIHELSGLWRRAADFGGYGVRSGSPADRTQANAVKRRKGVTMPRPPAVLGLIFCERLEVVTSPARMSLVGLFDQVRVESFPTVLSFTAYAGLYGGAGEGTIGLTMMHLETEEEVYRYRRWYALSGQGRFLNLEIRVRQWQVTAPGRFAANLRFDGQELTSRYLRVLKRTP